MRMQFLFVVSLALHAASPPPRNSRRRLDGNRHPILQAVFGPCAIQLRAGDD
jgi:hypothetical protein